MATRILDTCIHIRHWKQCERHLKQPAQISDMEQWAELLIRMYDTSVTLTPIRLELIAGTKSSDELQRIEKYLSYFQNADEGIILRQDWQEAERIARRVPRDGKPRQLGDCLIAAIARRLKYAIETFDENFPK
jgi:predicted nucleic acid-binding protein